MTPDFRMIARDQIRPNPEQPRKAFGATEMADLADSIRTNGILQPLLVRYRPSKFDGTPYIIIGGERRWRAAEGILEELPVIVKDVDDAEAERLAFIDNIQRVDLTPLEEAYAIRALMENQGLSLSQVVKVISAARRTVSGEGGVSEGWATNRLNLLKTGEDVQAVAEVRPDAMTALWQVEKVKEPELRAQLLEDVATGATYKATKQKVDLYLHGVEEKARADKASSQAPDTHTDTRQKAFSKGENSTTSRGQLVTGPKRGEVIREAERALVSLAQWAPKLTDDEFERLIEPTIRRLLRTDLRHEMGK